LALSLLVKTSWPVTVATVVGANFTTKSCEPSPGMSTGLVSISVIPGELLLSIAAVPLSSASPVLWTVTLLSGALSPGLR
jgi:hypothetical protein